MRHRDFSLVDQSMDQQQNDGLFQAGHFVSKGIFLNKNAVKR